MPDSRIRTSTIPGMGHIPIVMALARPFEQNGRVKREIAEFLDTVIGAGQATPNEKSGLPSAVIQPENE